LYGAININSTLSAFAAVINERTGVTANSYLSRETSDIAGRYRHVVRIDGTHEWGVGGASRTTFLWNSGTGALSLGTAADNALGALSLATLTASGVVTCANATADGHAVNRVTGDARYLTTAQFSTSVTLVSASEVKNYRIARITVPDTAYRYAVIPLAIKAGFAGQDEAILEIEWFRSGSGNGAILVHGHGPRSLRTSSFVRCEESSPNVIDIYVEAQDAITSGLWLYSWGRASRTNATSIDYTGGSWVDSFAPGSGASNGLFQEGGSISVNDVTCGAITSSGGVVSRGLSISENDYIYLKGNSFTDGSIRMYASGDDVFFQRRISGTWTNIFTIEG
jgi:hypothetical protein